MKRRPSPEPRLAAGGVDSGALAGDFARFEAPATYLERAWLPARGHRARRSSGSEER